MAVPPSASSSLIALSTTVRSRVSGDASRAREENSTSPTRVFGGSAWTNFSAACRAATIRDGFRSVAVIEPEVSTTSITSA